MANYGKVRYVKSYEDEPAVFDILKVDQKIN